MKNLKLKSPWQSFWGKVNALFEQDPDVKVGELIEDAPQLQYILPIEVRGHEKYAALSRLIPAYVIFGNIKVCIQLYDTENGSNSTEEIAELFRKAFEGNPVFRDVKVAKDQAETTHNFVRFEPVVLQFFDDNLGDFDGNWSGLASDLARDELFFDLAATGVHFCTAPKNATE